MIHMYIYQNNYNSFISGEQSLLHNFSSHSAVLYWQSANLIDSLIIFYSLIANDLVCAAIKIENYS